MPNKSLQDVAEKVMKKKKKPIDFKKLWVEICKELDFSEIEQKKKMAKFYNSMTLDSRFIQLEKNHWDLKSRQSYEKIKVYVETFDLDEEEELEFDEFTDEPSESLDTANPEVY